jgi:hypothetical protein
MVPAKLLHFVPITQMFIAEKEGEFNPTITFYTDYPVCNPNNFRFEKIQIYDTYIS